MAQRNSGYERVANDLYVTPTWVYGALYDVESFREPWDCAPVNADADFLATTEAYSGDIVTNPPFKHAEKFIRHALYLTRKSEGKVAMLLPLAYDSAKTRRHLFENHPFKAKYTLTRRIRWENLEQKAAGPSQNHAWFVWDWQYGRGKPFMGWLPKDPDAFTSIGTAANSVAGKLQAKIGERQ